MNDYDPGDEYIRQVVDNKQCNINDMSDEEITKVKNGWVFQRRFNLKSGTQADIGFYENKPYIGNIENYRVSRILDNNTGRYIYYVKLYCSLLLDDYGVMGFSFDTSANFTANSELTRTLINLGLDVCNIDELDLDSLMGMPIKATLIHKDGYNKINYLAKRIL